jgi:hypothetical protein
VGALESPSKGSPARRSYRGRRPPRHDHKAIPSDCNGILFRLAGSYLRSSRRQGGGRLENSVTAKSRGVDGKASRPSLDATLRSHAVGRFAWTPLLRPHEPNKAAKGRNAVTSAAASPRPGLALLHRNPKKRPAYYSKVVATRH